MNLNDFSYCYLNNIYRTGDVVAFELALADRLFKRCAISLVNSEQLIEIANMDNLIKDFKIVDGLLKCTTVKIVPAIPGIESEIGKLTEIKQDEGSFYALIREGSDKDYVMIDEKLMDVTGNEDNLVGAGLAKFTDIKLSNSTMSAYCRFTTENKIYNKMLVTLENGDIKFHSFYFGIPKIEDESGESNSSLGGMDYFSPGTSTLDKIEQRFLGVKRWALKQSILKYTIFTTQK